MKVSVIYNHETGAMLGIQYGQETACADVRNVILEIEDGEQITGLKIDGDIVAPIVEETQASALAREVKALNAQIAYLQMLSGVETEVGHE